MRKYTPGLLKARALAAARGTGFYAKKKSPEEGDCYLYDAIGSDMWGGGISAQAFKDELTKLGDVKRLNIYINSPGGDVFDGVAIRSMLARHPARKTVYVDGVAASAASFIMTVGDEIVANPAATIMIHRAWGMTVGDETDHRETADLLAKMDRDVILPLYARTGQSKEQLLAWMDAETWMSAEEALDRKFVDRIEGGEKEAAPPVAAKSVSPPRLAAGIAPGRPVAVVNAAPKQEKRMNPIEVLRERLSKLHGDTKAIEQKAAAEGRVDYTPEEQAQLEAIQANVAATDKQIEIHARNAALEASLSQPQPRLTTTPLPTPGLTASTNPRFSGGTRADAKDPKWGFRNLADQLGAIKASAYGNRDDRLMNAITTYGSEGVGGDGGFAVAPQFAQGITQIVTGEGSLVARMNPIMSGSNQVVLPSDETTPWGTTGVYAEWLEEAGAMSARKPALKQVTINLKKVGALVYLTDELMQDAPAIESYVLRKVAQAITAKVNEAIVNGDGVGKPLGLLKAPALVTVTDYDSSATLSAQDLGGMLARLVPEGINGAFWLMHTSVFPYLLNVTIGQQPVYTQSIRTDNPWGSIWNRPIVLTEYCSDWNTAGDIILVSPDGYGLAVKSTGVSTDMSIHFAFDQAVNAFRAQTRIGGVPLATAAITRKNGSNTLSHIVTLGARS